MNITKITVELEGLADLMFDRFYDHSGEDRPPERKIYYTEEGKVCIPAENIYSFLFRDMAPAGVIRFVEKRKAKDFLAMGQSHLSIEPMLIPILNGDGEPFEFDGFGPDKLFFINDWSAGVTKMSGGKVIKQEVKQRPVLRLPWSLAFDLALFENDKVTPDKLRSWFEVGGIVTALGSYRPRHGRFMVKTWDVIK